MFRCIRSASLYGNKYSLITNQEHLHLPHLQQLARLPYAGLRHLGKILGDVIQGKVNLYDVIEKLGALPSIPRRSYQGSRALDIMCVYQKKNIGRAFSYFFVMNIAGAVTRIDVNARGSRTEPSRRRHALPWPEEGQPQKSRFAGLHLLTAHPSAAQKHSMCIGKASMIRRRPDTWRTDVELWQGLFHAYGKRACCGKNISMGNNALSYYGLFCMLCPIYIRHGTRTDTHLFDPETPPPFLQRVAGSVAIAMEPERGSTLEQPCRQSTDTATTCMKQSWVKRYRISCSSTPEQLRALSEQGSDHTGSMNRRGH